MALNIPNYPNPYDPAHPLTSAYGWISGMYLDLAGGTGRIVLFIHPSASAANTSPPIAQVSITLGQLITPANLSVAPPTAEVDFPGLATLMADPTFAAAFGTIQSKLETALKTLPSLAGATSIL